MVEKGKQRALEHKDEKRSTMSRCKHPNHTFKHMHNLQWSFLIHYQPKVQPDNFKFRKGDNEPK